MSGQSMRLEVMWAIRDNRALNAKEKALLWAVESRGTSYGTWETVAADAGMSRNSFYQWRKCLQEKGMLVVTERPGRTTEYRVSQASLMEGAPPSDDRGLPGSGTGVSLNRVTKEDSQEHPQEHSQELSLPESQDGAGGDGIHFSKPSELDVNLTPQPDWDAWEESMASDMWFRVHWSLDMKRLYRDPLVENIT